MYVCVNVFVYHGRTGGSQVGGWTDGSPTCVFVYFCNCLFVCQCICISWEDRGLPGGRMDGWESDLSPKMVLGSFRGGASMGQGLTIKLEYFRIIPSLGRMRLTSPCTLRSRQLRSSITLFLGLRFLVVKVKALDPIKGYHIEFLPLF